MEAIILGQMICEKLKVIYFNDKDWPECYQGVAKKFGEFKQRMRKFYPEEDILDILKKVQKFDTLDIQEVFDLPFAEDETKLPQKLKYGDDVVWIPVPIDKPEVLEQIRKMLV